MSINSVVVGHLCVLKRYKLDCLKRVTFNLDIRDCIVM